MKSPKRKKQTQQVSRKARVVSGVGPRSGLAALAALPLVIFVSRLPFLNAGYGRDPDAWRLVNAAYTIAETGRYTVSRKPGYPVPEGAYALLHGAPSTWLPLVAMLCAAAGVMFALILRRLGSRDYVVGGLALAFTPTVFVQSTTVMDYTWALAAVVGALYCYMGGRFVVAGILAGIAVGCRISSLVVVPVILLGLFLRRDESIKDKVKHAVTFTVSAVAVGVLAYVPGMREHGLGLFGFVDASRSFASIVKTASIRLWGGVGTGALAIALVAGVVVAALRRRGETTFAKSPPTSDVYLWVAAVLVFFLVFLRLPLEAAYLITAVPFVLLCLAVFLPRVLFLFVCFVLFVSPFVEVERSGFRQGMVLVDHRVRSASMIKMRNMVTAIDRLGARKLVVLGGKLTPQLQVMARERGLYDRNAQLVIEPWVPVSQVDAYRMTGSEVYYVPDRDIYPDDVSVRDWVEQGARMLAY